MEVTQRISIKGMACLHCIRAFEQRLGQIEGVKAVEVNYDAREITVTHNGNVAPEELSAGIEDIGFEVVNIETI